MTTRRHRSKKERARLFELHGGICHICGMPIKVGEAWDISHEIPIALGGEDDDTNSKLAHTKCHRGKGSQTSKDQARIAKAVRQEAAHKGFKKPAGMKSRNDFPRSSKRKENPTPIPERRPMFRKVTT